jgi:hypothetical protein
LQFFHSHRSQIQQGLWRDTLQVAVELDWAALPWLPGAKEVLMEGVVSSLHTQNARAAAGVANFEQVNRCMCSESQDGEDFRPAFVP